MSTSHIPRGLLLSLGLVSAMIAIASEVGLIPLGLDVVFGPLVIVCLIAWVARDVKRNGTFGHVLLAALVLSFVADLVIKFSFIGGLAMFLLAHIAYLVAFVPRASLHNVVLPGIVYGAVAVGAAGIILPGAELQGMYWPVLIYMVFVTAMAVALTGAAIRLRGAYVRAAIGAALFFISDSLIGVTTFVRDFPYSAVAILLTYWVAQALIASVLLEPKDKRS